MRASPAVAERGDIAVPAQPHGFEMLGTGDMRDARAAEASEMLHRQGGAALVIGQKAKRVGIVGLAEDVDDRQAVGERSDRRALVGASRA